MANSLLPVGPFVRNLPGEFFSENVMRYGRIWSILGPKIAPFCSEKTNLPRLYQISYKFPQGTMWQIGVFVWKRSKFRPILMWFRVLWCKHRKYTSNAIKSSIILYFWSGKLHTSRPTVWAQSPWRVSRLKRSAKRPKMVIFGSKKRAVLQREGQFATFIPNILQIPTRYNVANWRFRVETEQI